MELLITPIRIGPDSGELCVFKSLSPVNPEIFEIPLTEFFEDSVNKRVWLLVETSETNPKDRHFSQWNGLLKIQDNKVYIDSNCLHDDLQKYLDKEVHLLLTRFIGDPNKAVAKPESFLGPALPHPNLSLWYQSSASKWTDALPIGNGHFGAMIFGSFTNDVIQFNEDTVFFGGPLNRINPDGKKYLAEIRNLLMNNKVAQGQQLAQMALQSIPCTQNPYQILSNLIFFFEGKSSEFTTYQRVLDLEDGIAWVDFTKDKIQYHREYFCNYPDDVMVVKFSANQANKLNFRCRFERKDPLLDPVESNGKNQLVTFNQCGPNGIHYVLGMRVSNKEGSVEIIGENLIVKDATEVIMYLSAATSYRYTNPMDQVKFLLDRADKLGYNIIKQHHLDDHHGIFNRLSLELPRSTPETQKLPTDIRLQQFKAGFPDPDLTVLYFQYGRYLLEACSRPGSLPANLQGLWSDSLSPPWESKYTININTEMNYWLAEPCNLSECHLPLFDHLRKMQVDGTKTARDLYGCSGWVAHHNTNLWADTAPVDRASCATWPMGGAWLSLHLWEHFLFTKDQHFLKNEAYPLMRGAAEFFTTYLIMGPNGYLLCGPSVSPENTYGTPDGQSAVITMEASMDYMILRELFMGCIEAENILDFDKDFGMQLSKLMAQFPPTRKGKYGQIMEWGQDYEEREPGHRHMSHLFALHPGTQISPQKTPELAEAAKKTLYRRLSFGGGHTGWSCAWIINFWARLQEPVFASFFLQTILTQSTFDNLFDAHPPFQIDGNFGATVGIVEMLVQSHQGFIQFLPALPQDWNTGKIKGVKARGNFELNLEWKENKMVKANISAGSNGPCRLQIEGSIKIYTNNQLVSFKNLAQNLIEFEAKAGYTYLINF